MTYADMANVPTQTAGTSPVIASDWNTYVKANFNDIKGGHIICTSTTRPSTGLVEGVMVYETDTNKVMVYDGAAWSEVLCLDNVGDLSTSGLAYTNQVVANRNVIINGAMQVAQRGTSSTGITGGGYYTADRWSWQNVTLGTWTHTVENDAPTGSGFRKSYKILCTTADNSPAAADQARFNQFIEGQNLQHFAKGTSSAKKFALQFWVKSNITGTHIVELYDIDNQRQVSASYTISASGTWEKKTVVFPADTTGALDNDNGGSFALIWWLGCGTNFRSGTLNTSWASVTDANRAVGQTNVGAAVNNYIQFTGVQLEAGDFNTTFEFEPYDVTQNKCYRYYYRRTADDVYGDITNVGIGIDIYYIFADIQFPVTMRAIPTSLETGGSFVVTDYTNSFPVTTFTGTVRHTKSFGQVKATTAGTLTANRPYVVRANNDAAAYIGFNAEL